MSIRLEMLQVARLARNVLADSSQCAREFLRGQQHEDGGFKNRGGESDLYYTVFGLDALSAIQEAPHPATPRFLESFGAGEEMDFVHLCCLARCWSAIAGIPQGDLLSKIETHRTPDGGYNVIAGAEHGNVYACFLALSAYQDLRGELPEPLRLIQSLKFLETTDGAWSNEREMPIGSTNATAAAITLLRNLNMPINPRAADWLLARAHRDGGFIAAPDSPLPDLLSTATALHALSGMEVPFDSFREQCLDFIDSLWTNEGGFHGHWADDELDCEYTFYGLLALGHLSL